AARAAWPCCPGLRRPRRADGCSDRNKVPDRRGQKLSRCRQAWPCLHNNRSRAPPLTLVRDDGPFADQQAVHYVTRVGFVGHGQGPAEVLGGGELGGRAVVAAVTPELNETADAAAAAVKGVELWL